MHKRQRVYVTKHPRPLKLSLAKVRAFKPSMKRHRRQRMRTAAIVAIVLVTCGLYFHYEFACKVAEIFGAWYGVFELLVEF